MKKTTLTLFITLILFLILSFQTVNAYYYEEPDTSDDDTLTIVILIIVLAVIIMVVMLVIVFLLHISAKSTVQEHLDADEHVIGRFGYLFATNKRLIHCRLKHEYEVYKYNELTINYERPGGVIAGRIILIIMGAFMVAMSLVILLLLGDFIIFLFLLISSILMIISTAISPWGFYQIRGPGFDKMKERFWRIPPSMMTNQFIETLKQKINSQTKEYVPKFCKSCGFKLENPRKHCPKCGNKI